MAHWLFKTEPSCFSFDDLKRRPDMTEHWDGVRNYQARNYLRDAVQVGDELFIYHSNIPEPAVVGIAVVVRAGYPDFTAFDPHSEHFDPRSAPERPVWYMVDVRYIAPLPRPVLLSAIREQPLLAAMPLVNRSRLSIQPVTPEEWRIICAMGGREG